MNFKWLDQTYVQQAHLGPNFWVWCVSAGRSNIVPRGLLQSLH